MKPGTVGINDGAMMAAADRITIEITGRGSHGAHPYQTVDVVLGGRAHHHGGAGHVPRARARWTARVISLRRAGRRPGRLQRAAGPGCHFWWARCAFDPAACDMRSASRTCATLSPQVRRHGHAALRAHLAPRPSILRARRASPATWPRPWWASDNVDRDLEPSMGAEDFSFMPVRLWPGAYLRLGQAWAGQHAAQQPL